MRCTKGQGACGGVVLQGGVGRCGCRVVVMWLRVAFKAPRAVWRLKLSLCGASKVARDRLISVARCALNNCWPCGFTLVSLASMLTQEQLSNGKWGLNREAVPFCAALCDGGPLELELGIVQTHMP